MEESRASRFHGAGSWPEDLDKVLRTLLNSYKTVGYVPSKGEFRALCARVNKRRYQKGAADECLRLLKNRRVVVDGEHAGKAKMLFDPARCKALLHTVTDNAPYPELDPKHQEKQVARLLKALEKRTRTAAEPKSPPPPPVAAPIVEQVAAPAAVTPQEDPMRRTVATQTQPAPSPAPASAPKLTSVAFLPPGPLGEVWLYLAVNARKLESYGTRVGIPISGVPDGLACTRDEFLETLNLFHNADVLDLVGVSGGNKNAFVLKIHPDSIHIVEIKKIVEHEVPATWLEIANRVRSEIPNSRLAAKTARGYISEWIEQHYPDLNGNTGAAKVMGYLPNSNRLDYSWGYLYKPEGSDTYLRCLVGLEPIRLIPTDAPAVRYRTKGSLPPAAPASPAPAPVPTAPVAPSVDVLRLANTLAAGSLDSTLAQLDENIARLIRTRELVGQLATERMEFEKHRHAADASEARIAQIREELRTLGY